MHLKNEWDYILAQQENWDTILVLEFLKAIFLVKYIHIIRTQAHPILAQSESGSTASLIRVSFKLVAPSESDSRLFMNEGLGTVQAIR